MLVIVLLVLVLIVGDAPGEQFGLPSDDTSDVAGVGQGGDVIGVTCLFVRYCTQRPPSVFRQSHKVSGCTSALKICGFWRPEYKKIWRGRVQKSS